MLQVIYDSAEYAVYQNSRKLAMTMGFSTIKTNPIATGQNPIRSSPQTSLRTIRLPPRPASRDDHDDALDHKRDDQNQMNDRDHASHRMRAQRNRKGYTCLDSQLASGLRMSISVGTTQTCTLRWIGSDNRSQSNSIIRYGISRSWNVKWFTNAGPPCKRQNRWTKSTSECSSGISPISTFRLLNLEFEFAHGFWWWAMQLIFQNTPYLRLVAADTSC